MRPNEPTPTEQDMRQMTRLGRQIEADSFRIVDDEVGPHDFSPHTWQVVRRVIHATADFEYKQLVHVHPQAVERGIAALRAGANLVVDVQMIQAGLNRARLDHYGCRIHHHISDADVIEKARETGGTRAIEAMRKAWRLGLLDGAIVAVGNAPTALLEVLRLIHEEGAKPALLIGVPVGFVSAAESKEAVVEADYPHIVTRGRKGGSPIAVAIVHALLQLSTQEGS